MKNKILTAIIFLGVFSIIFLGSCNKKIDEAYLQPNAPANPPIENILPGVIGSFTTSYAAAGTNFGTVVDATFIGRYIQYFSLNSANDTWGQMSMLGGAVDNGGGLWAGFYFAQGN